MADKSENHAELELSPAVHAPNGPRETQEVSQADAKFEPKAYYFGAWHLLKNDLFVFLWKLGADLLRAGVSIATLALIGVVTMVGFADALSAPQGALVGIDRYLQRLATPAFVVGVTGLLVCVWLVGLMLEVLVLSGAWGLFAAGARGERIERFRTFFANLTTRFPEVLSLRVTTLAAQATIALLAVAIFVSVSVATTGDGALADASIWTRALLWATPLTLLAGLAALVRLTMEVAAAPLLVEGRTLGDAVLTAARLVVAHFIEVYRLLIVAAGLLLVPLFLYWGVLTFGNLTMDVAELAPVNTLLRFAGEAILFVATGAIALLFYGAVFLYYAHKTDMIDRIPGGHSNGKPEKSSNGAASSRPDLDETTTLDDLLPEDYPNIIDLDDVTAHSPSEDRALDDEDLSGDDIFDADDDLDSDVDDRPPGDDVIDSDEKDTHDRD